MPAPITTLRASLATALANNNVWNTYSFPPPTITANSDVNLKKNLLKIENALEKVEQINGYTYEFKADDSKRHAGVIAQEIETVLPEIVNKGNDGILGVEYGNISALLIEAIKEQNIKIKNLETLLASK